MSKYIVASVQISSGIAKASGNPYSIPRALVLVPFQSRETQNYHLKGSGFTPVELSVSESFYPELEKHFVMNFKGFPLELDFSTSLDSQGRNLLTGFEKTGSTAMSYSPAKAGA